MHIKRIHLSVFVPGDRAHCLPKWAHGKDPRIVGDPIVVKSEGVFSSFPLADDEAKAVVENCSNNAIEYGWPLSISEEEVLFQALTSDCPDGLWEIKTMYEMEE